MLDFKTISKIFSDFLNDRSVVSDSKSGDRLAGLIRSNIETNLRIWNLEDSARIGEFGLRYIVDAKHGINENNQVRNDLVMAIDTEIANQMKVAPFDSQKKFHSESPGMIIDRLAILHIKIAVIRNLLALIKESDLMQEYIKKEHVVLGQVGTLGNFLDDYFNKIKRKEIIFEIQQSIKIYNDERVKKYIMLLKQNGKRTSDINT